MLNVTKQSLAMATQLLLDGQVVAFPTETVYGLGAWAFSESGVARIYEAKGRPSDNPLIVHIAPGADLHSLVSSVPPAASALMQRFWPGPLTLIMPKGPAISPRITGGLDTVAIRMPAHPAAIRLLEVSGLPLVAPSANTSGKPSPHYRAPCMGRSAGTDSADSRRRPLRGRAGIHCTGSDREPAGDFTPRGHYAGYAGGGNWSGRGRSGGAPERFAGRSCKAQGAGHEVSSLCPLRES